MPTIHFTGNKYNGMDGKTEVVFPESGYYEVSESKAQQLITDFPDEHSIVHEGNVVETPTETPVRDESTEGDQEFIDKAAEPKNIPAKSPKAARKGK